MRQSIIQKLNDRDVAYTYYFNQPVGVRVLGNNPSVEDIKNIIINQTQYIIHPEEEANVNINGYLLSMCSPTFIAEIVSSLGFRSLNDTIDVFYNLLWYINRFSDPFGTGLTTEEINYISGLNGDELLSLFPRTIIRYKRYNKAGLLYSVISGKRILFDLDHSEPRYQEVSSYSPKILWKILSTRYSYGGRLQNHPPYEYITQRPLQKDAIEQIFLIASTHNLPELMERYQVVLPPNIEDNPEAKLDEFLKIISEYTEVFNRPPNILPPPNLLAIRDLYDDNRLRTILKQYTVRELLDAYEPFQLWISYHGLILVIIREIRSGPSWRWRHRHCKNDDTDNLTEFEPHGNMNKDDPNDPTLSYGLQQNYKCYQVKELIEMFTQYPGEFKVPDYHPGNMGIDPTTGIEYAETFPINSIVQLKELLTNIPQGYPIDDLKAIINTGLLARTNILILRMTDEYNRFTRERQDIIKLYIAWVFLYGMWMRFWKGPGNPWPYDPKTQVNICIPASRDEHIFIQNKILENIRSRYANDPILLDWINRLPTVNYSFTTNEFNVRRINLTRKIERYLVGAICMGFGGDTFTQTGYYLITRLFRLNTIDAFISEMLPTLLDMERQVVNDQLAPNSELITYINTMRAKGEQIQDEILEKLRVLQERQMELNNPQQTLPIFDPTRMVDNRHVERF